MLQVTSFTILKNKVVIIGGLKSLMQMHNIIMLDVFYNAYFFGNKFSLIGIQPFQRYHFYRKFISQTFFLCLKDFSSGPFAYPPN